MQVHVADPVPGEKRGYGRECPGDRVRRTGGDLKYLTMDEPFYYGHKDSSPTACHESVQAVAKAVAERVRVIRGYFPNVRIGDDEVVNSSRAWIDELAGFVDAYRGVT